jgi:two-component system OmpR family sensor kinase
LQIEDTGPGIPAEERARVFDRFYRLPGSSAEGSGLGLAIAKQVADAHGAEITLDEAADGHGLRVTVRFKRALIA